MQDEENIILPKHIWEIGLSQFTMMDVRESIDKLFSEPFEPSWMRRRRIQAEQEALEEFGIGIDTKWRQSAIESRIHITKNHYAPIAPPKQEWSERWLFVRHVVKPRDNFGKEASL